MIPSIKVYNLALGRQRQKEPWDCWPSSLVELASTVFSIKNQGGYWVRKTLRSTYGLHTDAHTMHLHTQEFVPYMDINNNFKMNRLYFYKIAMYILI